MLKFDNNEQRSIMRYYQDLKDSLGDQEYSPENIAMELLYRFPDMDHSQLVRDCMAMESGIRRFMEAYGDPESGEPVDVDQVLQELTADMDEQQRNGFYLDAYESLRLSDCDILEEAEAAQSAPELIQSADMETLRELVAEQVTLDAEALAGDCIEDIPANAFTETAPDPTLCAAALYAASLDGSIDDSYAAYPELTGTCAAAAATFARQMNANPEKAKDKRWVGKVIVGICAAALLTALAIYAAPAVIAGVQSMIAQFSWSNAAVFMKRQLLPVLKTAKYWLPAALLSLRTELAAMTRPAVDKLRELYQKLQSRTHISKEFRPVTASEEPEEEIPLDTEEEMLCLTAAGS